MFCFVCFANFSPHGRCIKTDYKVLMDIRRAYIIICEFSQCLVMLYVTTQKTKMYASYTWHDVCLIILLLLFSNVYKVLTIALTWRKLLRVKLLNYYENDLNGSMEVNALKQSYLQKCIFISLTLTVCHLIKENKRKEAWLSSNFFL